MVQVGYEGRRRVSGQIPKKEYERELLKLQGELATMTEWIRQSRARVVVLFEGRDAAGKGGVIKRISQYLSPRTCRIVALPTPTDRERGEWYFQRYVRQLPTAGEMTLFDRSWYNRAGVERVMGFCSDEEYQRFLRQCPAFEHQLLEDGIILVKYWFSVSDEEQERRFQSRVDDPLRRWKLSPMDLEARQRWVDYSKAKDHMFLHTDTPESPWFVVEADEKRRARLNCIAHLLSRVPYQPVDESRLKLSKRAKGESYERPPRGLSTYVPDYAGSLHQ
jgi:polyphosphate kinase